MFDTGRQLQDVFAVTRELRDCQSIVRSSFFGMVMTRRNLEWWCERGILSLAVAMRVFVLWAIRLWAHPKPRLLWPPLCWVVVAFVLYATARYFTADIEYVA